MIWFILFPAIAILFTIGKFIVDRLKWEAKPKPKKTLWPDYSKPDASMYFLGGMVGILVAGIIAAAFNGLAMIWVGGHEVNDWSVDLQAIRSGDQTNGSFFLGSGYIKDTQVFNYLYKIGPDSYQRGYWEADQSTITESNDTPHMDHYTTKSDNFWVCAFRQNETERVVFYVPKGSVVNDYKVTP